MDLSRGLAARERKQEKHTLFKKSDYITRMVLPVCSLFSWLKECNLATIFQCDVSIEHHFSPF